MSRSAAIEMRELAPDGGRLQLAPLHVAAPADDMSPGDRAQFPIIVQAGTSDNFAHVVLVGATWRRRLEDPLFHQPQPSGRHQRENPRRPGAAPEEIAVLPDLWTRAILGRGMSNPVLGVLCPRIGAYPIARRHGFGVHGSDDLRRQPNRDVSPLTPQLSPLLDRLRGPTRPILKVSYPE